MFTKRVMSKTKKIFIYGGGTLASFLFLLFSLSFYGVNVQTSGDQVCGETCISYFNISLDSYALCMGSTFTGVTVEPQVKYEIYKADARYRSDNPNRWKPYDFKASTCLKNGTNHEFKLIGYKNPEQTIKWGLTLSGPDKDPFWYGINESTATTSVSNNITMELGARVNISTNITGSSTVCVDIDHPEYGTNYTCGSPMANFMFNISYFRKGEFNDSTTSKNLTWGTFLNNPITALEAGWADLSPLTQINDSNQVTYANNTGSAVSFHFTSINFTIDDTFEINNLRFLMNWSSNGSQYDQDATCGAGTSFCFYNWSSSSFVAVGSTLSSSAGSYLLNASLPSDAISVNGTVYMASDQIYSGNGVVLKVYEIWLSYNNLDTSTSNENFTVYINGHQYDEIRNVSVNLTGFAYQGETPTSVKIYVNGTLSNNLDYMVNEQGTINKLNDTSTSKNYSFDARGTKTDYLYIIKGAQIGSAYFNVTGFNILTGLEGVCYQETATTAGGCGGLNTGTYWNDVSDTYYNDGDWATRKDGYVSTSGVANYQVNYSRPVAFLYNGTKLQVKFMLNYGDTTTNVTLLPSCLANNPVRTRLNFSHTGTYGTFRVLCYDTAWQSLYSSTSVSNYNGMGLYEEGIYWNFINNSLTNISVDIGDIDGTPEYNYTGYFTTTGKSINFNNTLTTYLSTCTEDSNHFCTVPIYFTSQKSGLLQINNINISYDYDVNPVYLNSELISNFIGNSTGAVNIPVTFSSSQNGTLQISDLRYDYLGGNDTITVSTYPASECYQETATTNTTCGGLNTGSYTPTQGSGTTCARTYVNYTKPSNAVSAKWRVKHGNVTDTEYNVTIPSSCFDYSSQIALYFCSNSLVNPEGSASTGSHSEGYCLGSSGWQQITQTKSLSGTSYDRSVASSALYYDGDWGTYVSGPLWGNDNDVNSPSTSRIYEEGIYWSLQENLSLIVHYSDFFKNLPYTWTDTVFFIPRTNSSKNVSAYGQKTTIPVYNITTTNYGGKNMNLFTYLNETNSCIDILVSSNNTKPSRSLWRDLVGYYPFDIDARDVSGNNKNATTNVATHNQSGGQMGGAYEFDGINDEIQLGSTNPLGFNISKNYTFSFWFKLNGHNPEAATYVSDPILEISDTTKSIVIGVQTNLSVFSYSAGTKRIGSNVSLLNNTWYQGIITFESNASIKIYLNGSLRGSGSLIVANCDNHNMIGEENCIDADFFNGTIDEVRIYNKSLNQAEITELYTREKNKYYDNKLLNEWTAVKWNLNYLNNSGIWMWADLDNCNASNQRIFNPGVYFQSSCIDCITEEI
jgi:hypothetical protein